MIQTYFRDIQDYMLNVKNGTTFTIVNFEFYERVQSLQCLMLSGSSLKAVLKIITELYRVNSEQYLIIPDNSGFSLLGDVGWLGDGGG